MLDYRLSFDSPYYLALLGLIPILWLIGRRSMAGLGPVRRNVAFVIRSLLVVLLALALAEVQLVRTSQRVAVLYVVDRSQSVPAEKGATLAEYIHESAHKHQDLRREDRAGVIVFGRDAAVESPPLTGETHLPARFEAIVDPQATNLAQALRLAQAVFPADAAKRVVVISDGNENVGDALAQAQSLAELGIGIDVLPLARGAQREVMVDKLVLPTDIRQGTPFEARVVLSSAEAEGNAEGKPITGRLRVTRTAGGQSQNLADQAVSLTGGKQVFSFREEIASPDFYTYSARFVPDDAGGDTLQENNEATAFTHVRGRGQVLVIEDWVKPGQSKPLVDLLGRQNLEVTVQPSNQLFANLAELQRYDLVILSDVPRASGEAAEQLTQFSDAQLEMLVQNTQHLGAGLLMIGGPDSFGAGGWTNTALEKAMPVDFQVKNAKVMPRGALMLVIDSSGSMSGEKLELSKAAAMAAVRVLSNDDYVGVVSFDSAAHWVVPMTQIQSPDAIARRVAKLASGGGTDMEPGMSQGYSALEEAPAAVKHMIILTDGQTAGSNFISMATKAKNQKITTSCVAIGRGSAVQLLSDISHAGGGKFYAVDNPRTVPRIFMKEAMRVARPVIFEDPAGILPQRTGNHEILDGIAGDFPPITGYIMTTPKESPLVEIALQSARPVGNKNSILASWQFGLGRSVVFTTDVDGRWTKSWPEWAGFEKLFAQMVRWTMRPTDDQTSLNVFAEAQDGAIQVVVTALDKDDQFVNFMDLNGSLVDPQMRSRALPLKQTAPGRYVGRLEAAQPGSYFVSISAGAGTAPARAGVNVPYSAEFKNQQDNPQLLRGLAALQPVGGSPGVVLPEPASAKQVAASLETNVFRPDLQKATSRQASWYVLAFLAGCLFLADVFNRRVIVSFAWVGLAIDRVRNRLWGRPLPASETRSLERLQARKGQLDRELEERRANVRFEPEPAATNTSGDTLQESLTAQAASTSNRPKPDSRQQLAPQAEQEAYTARLLKAKKQVWKDRKGPDNQA